MSADYVETTTGYYRLDVWQVLDLICAEFESDPMSVQCFDLRLVARAIELRNRHKADVAMFERERLPADLADEPAFFLKKPPTFK